VRVAVLGREHESPCKWNSTLQRRIRKKEGEKTPIPFGFLQFFRVPELQKRKTEVPGCGGGSGAPGAGALGGWFQVDLEERAVGCSTIVSQSSPSVVQKSFS
jgi:hypothetical protein